ncbi:unnamed protein product [Rodentolepis nana]|uniref:Saposin B-type domain-containing protein n=1 Tax=Rodentolepis nana TaxID=102285 RepID=A0A0R3TMC3_RODNA|nr:unnamed protein product [Rodentolepis nana]
MPRPKKKPTWWGDPGTQAVVRRGLLYLIRNIYGGIPSSVKVRLKHKAKNAFYQDQNSEEESTRMRSTSEVEYCGACQEIYGKVDDYSSCLSTTDTSPHIKIVPEKKIPVISKRNILGESAQDCSEISYFSDKECLIKLLQQLYPEVANCLRQADHTSSVYLEDLCACLLAIYEAIETPETENDLKYCLLQFIEQLYPDLSNYIAKNTSNASARGMINNACKENMLCDCDDKTEEVGEFNTESTMEELTSDLSITYDVETEDSQDILDECLMELTQRICAELAEDTIESTESSEECDCEEDEEELLDTSEEADDEVVNDCATYAEIAECFRNCLVELIPKLWPERPNCCNQSGGQTCKSTVCIPTQAPKVESQVRTCLPQPCTESPCCINQSATCPSNRSEGYKETCEIKCAQATNDSTCNVCVPTQAPKVESQVRTCLPQPCTESPCCINQSATCQSNRSEGYKETCESKCAQVTKDSTCNVCVPTQAPKVESQVRTCLPQPCTESPCCINQSATCQSNRSEGYKSHKNGDCEIELDDVFLVKCILQLIQQLCPELIESVMKGSKPKEEVCKVNLSGECRNQEGFAVADKQKCDGAESETDLEGLNKCFAQLIQYLDNEMTPCVENTKKVKFVECKVKETESAKITCGQCNQSREEIPAELIEEILVKCFLLLIKQMYPEMFNCIMQSTGAKIDTGFKRTMGVSAKHEIQKLCENEQNICWRQSDNLTTNKECGKKSEWTEEALRRCLLEHVQQLIREIDCCPKVTADKTLTTATGTSYKECCKENNDPAAEWNKEDIRELLRLVQKLCPELADCIRGCESGKVSDPDQCDEEESTLGENDLIDSLFQFMDQTNPKLCNYSDGSDTETEWDEETMRNCFLKFVEELYPDLAPYTKQSLGEINKAEEECEMPQKVTQDFIQCENMVCDESKMVSKDNSVRECLEQFVQQISPELADCIKKYNDCNSTEAEISDISILEVSEALEASLSDGDIKDCLVKLVDLLCPDLGKYIRESDKSCDPCEPEGTLVDISEGSECASIEDSLRDSFISFIEEAYPELVDCIKHIKKATNDDDEEESEIDRDETTIDESIFDEVKTEETMNVNIGEESQAGVLSIFEQLEDEEEKSEMTITPDHFTEDVQLVSGEPDYSKNFNGEYGMTVSCGADDNTEAQSVNFSQEISIIDDIHPLTSINETQTDLTSEDIFEDCFMQLLKQFDADLACCIMENLPESSSLQIEDSNVSGDVISGQPNESQENSENPPKVKFSLFEDNTPMFDENTTNGFTSNLEYPMESHELVEKTDDLVTDENLSMVSEVILVVNENTTMEERSALTDELSATKIGELLNPGVLSSDFSQVEPSTNQNITSHTNTQFEDSDINAIGQKEEEGTLFDSIFDEILYATEQEESKCGVDSERVQGEECESTTEDVMVEKSVPLFEYGECDGNVESPIMKEKTCNQAEINEQLYQEWIKCASGMDIESVEMNGDEDDVAKDCRIESVESETCEGNYGDWDELRVCLLAIADEFYPELANCIRKCLAEEEKGGVASEFEADRRNMQMCLENFAAKFYAKPEQDDSVSGVKNVEEMYTPTVKYIQQLILDFAQIFHPTLAHSLQQQ